MKKLKLKFLIMTIIILITSIFTIPTTALSVGDKLGDVLNTDIKTYINGERIPCYNIDNKSAILIADLRNYGFDVVYDDNIRSSTVTRNYDKTFTPIKDIANNTAQVGTVAFSYVYTDIIAIVNGKRVDSFNVQGNLAIFFSELGDYGTFEWDNNARASKLTLNFNIAKDDTPKDTRKMPPQFSSDPVESLKQVAEYHIYTYEYDNRGQARNVKIPANRILGTPAEDYWVYNYYTISSVYSYDVKRTDSLVSSYEGVITFTMIAYTSKERNSKQEALAETVFNKGGSHKHIHRYLFQNGKWVVIKRQTYIPELDMGNVDCPGYCFETFLTSNID